MTETIRTGQTLPQHASIRFLLAGAQGLDTGAPAAILKTAGLKKWRKKKGASDQPLSLRVFRDDDAVGRAGNALAESPEAVLLLSYPAPMPFIARALTAGCMPEEALRRWLEKAEPILDLYRTARRRIVLVEQAAALANPQALIARLNERFSLSLVADRSMTPATAEPRQPELDPVYLLIAERACRQDLRARRAVTELEASSLPLGSQEGMPIIDLAATLEAYRQQPELPEEPEKPAQDIEDLTEENELLLLQLHQVQEELESYFLENQDLKKTLKECELQKQQFERKARQATNMFNDVHASLSWKITAPLRAMIRPFRGK